MVSKGAPRSVILKTYDGPVMRPALVFVGRNMLKQWETEIKKFNPSLRYFVVSDIRSLKKFYQILMDPLMKEINRFDLILVKNEKITGTWEFINGEIVEHVNRNIDGEKRIFNVISNICRNMWFTRIIIDDFDTIKLPPLIGNINTLFTWLVSSTKKLSKRNHYWMNYEHDNLADIMKHNYISINDVINNQVLYTLFEVRIQDSYYKKFLQVGRPKFFMYKFKNPSGHILQFINALASNCEGGDKISEIMEALNGNAIDQAAKLAGVHTSDPNKIFKALLQKNYDKIAESKRILKIIVRIKYLKLDYLEKVEDALPQDLPENEDGTPRRTYNKTDLREDRPVLYKFPGFKSLIDDEFEFQEQELKDSTRVLENFKNSICEDANCQICSGPLMDPDEQYAILPCCHEMLHAYCVTRGLDFHKETNARGIEIVGNCPFNRNHRVRLQDMTYVKNDVDFSKIDVDNFPDPDASNVEISEIRNFLLPVKIERGKFQAVIDIIYNRILEEKEEVFLKIPHLLVGKKKLPEPNYVNFPIENIKKQFAELPESLANYIIFNKLNLDQKPRCLIFANFEETLDGVQTILDANHVNYARLSGSTHALNAAIEGFQLGTIDHLLINSITHCQGLNLQMATDLIFVHHIKEKNIMSQVSGRIQRFGRTVNANFHFICYENEKLQILEDYKDPNPVTEEDTPPVEPVSSKSKDDGSDNDDD